MSPRDPRVRPVTVEACVTTASEAAASALHGAHRAEICRDLHLGGLTSPRADVSAALAVSDVPVFALVRRQAETFRLGPREVAGLVADVEALVPLGIGGVVVGVLDRSGRIDVAAMIELVAASAGAPVTFHRAFDELADPVGGVEPLRRAGVSRVLTSGGAPSAWEGRAVLRTLVAAAEGGPVIMGGGGVRGDHARELVDGTGLREVHARASAIPGIVAALGG